jgi:hypothetical protein
VYLHYVVTKVGVKNVSAQKYKQKKIKIKIQDKTNLAFSFKAIEQVL